MVEQAESTVRIQVDGEECLVHHAQHVEKGVLSDIASFIADKRDSYDFNTERNHMTETLLENAPPIAAEVDELLETRFIMGLEENDMFDELYSKAAFNLQEFMVYDDTSWRSSLYDKDEPSTADVIGAFLSLMNASLCVEVLEDNIKKQQGEDADTIFTDDYFNVHVTKGIMLSFRDAHLTHTPTEAIYSIYFRDRAKAIQDAVSNFLSYNLSDAELQGLMLAHWNKDVCLQSASSHGKEKSVNEGMKALEDITNIMKQEKSDSE